MWVVIEWCLRTRSLTICIVSLELSLHYLFIIAAESCGLPKLNNLFFSDPEGMAKKLQLRPHPRLQTLIPIGTIWCYYELNRKLSILILWGDSLITPNILPCALLKRLHRINMSWWRCLIYSPSCRWKQHPWLCYQQNFLVQRTPQIWNCMVHS